MTAPLKATKKKLAANPPRTTMEVYDLLPENTRSEVIDNTLYISPERSFGHQEVSEGNTFSDTELYKKA